MYHRYRLEAVLRPHILADRHHGPKRQGVVCRVLQLLDRLASEVVTGSTW